MSITLRQLEVFVAAVKYGSFRRCAEELEITPVSVSEHIRELEKRLKCTIFSRKPGQSAQLTDAGKSVLDRSRKILDDVNVLASTFEPPAAERQRILVNMHACLGSPLLTTFDSFRSQHAQVDLRVNFANISAEAIIDQVLDNRIDLAYVITFGSELKEIAELFCEEKMGIVVARDHPLARCKSVNRAQLRNIPSINLLPENPLRRLTDRVLEQAGIENSPIGLETDEFPLMLDSLAKGMGYTCMFEKNLATRDVQRRLTLLKLDFPLADLKVRTLISPRAERMAAVKLLRQQLSSAYHQPYGLLKAVN
jgi:DNA-binding transcriptional LysR family regulator